MEYLRPSPGDLVSRAAELAWSGLCEEQEMPPMDWEFQNRDDYWVMVGRPEVSGLDGLDSCVEWMERASEGFVRTDVALRDGYGSISRYVGGVQVELELRVDEDHRREWEDLQFATERHEEARRDYDERERAWREQVLKRYSLEVQTAE